MEFKGTKGNWEVVDNGLSVFTENRVKSIAFDGQICRLHTGTVTYKNAKINAKLIAKAPELLELLNQFVTISDELNAPDHLIETFANLYANAFNTIQEATTINP